MLCQQLDEFTFYRFLHHFLTQNQAKSKSLNSFENKKILDDKLKKLKQAKTDLDDFTNIISAFKSEKYLAITGQITDLEKKIQTYESSKSTYIGMRNDFSGIITKYTSILPSEDRNPFDSVIREMLKIIDGTLEGFPEASEIKTNISDIAQSLGEFKQELSEYLNAKGFEEENKRDYERAIEKIPSLEQQIRVLNQEIEAIKKEINAFTESNIINQKEAFKATINAALTPLNNKLKSTNANVKDIEFKYEYDNEKAKYELFEAFVKEFGSIISRTRNDSLEIYLFATDPLEVTDKKSFLDKLDAEFPNSTANAKSIIQNIFSEDVNFEIYKLLITKYFNNSNEYKKIVGFYAGKELKDCSFGQRCTAVIVALLTFGNKPLIIDEPEAHLDSKLIAEYLVDLIKAKKMQRQIIFATHNANFVINGDADLIHCLEMDDNNLTQITSTSIENLNNREKILALEGGRRAFEMRVRYTTDKKQETIRK